MSYSPNDALTVVQNLVHGVPTAAIQAQACDQVNSMIWTFYPWAWTIKSLTPINCSQGTQDYAPTNTDILRPLKLRLVRTDVTPNEFREMALLANLSPELTRTGGLETITSCGWYASGPFIRLMYAASVSGTQTLQIQGEYQAVPTTITAANITSTFAQLGIGNNGLPDRYFNGFVEGLLWKLYQLSDDPRAGTMQYAKNGSYMRQYSGQLGIFMDALLQMARTEDLASGDQFEFPAQPLGVGRSYWPGLYGV